MANAAATAAPQRMLYTGRIDVSGDVEVVTLCFGVPLKAVMVCGHDLGGGSARCRMEVGPVLAGRPLVYSVDRGATGRAGAPRV